MDVVRKLNFYRIKIDVDTRIEIEKSVFKVREKTRQPHSTYKTHINLGLTTMKITFSALGMLIAFFIMNSQSFASDKFASKIEAISNPVKNNQISFQNSQQREMPHVVSSRSGITLYVTSDLSDTPEYFAEKTFDCVGKIRVAAKFDKNNSAFRNQRFWVRWVNPDGETELMSTKLNHSERGQYAIRWGGMVLSRPQGGGLFSLLDPSAGMERFIGDWTVILYVGSEEYTRENFLIEC